MGGVYTDRSSTYCRTQSADNATYAARAECDGPEDLPLAGGCEDIDGASYKLSKAMPEFDSTEAGEAAAYSCQWLYSGTATPPQASGLLSAHICCIALPAPSAP